MNDVPRTPPVDRVAAERVASILARQREPEGRAERERLTELLVHLAHGGDVDDRTADPEALLVVEAFTLPDTAGNPVGDEPVSGAAGEVAAVLDRLAVLGRIPDGAPAPRAAGARASAERRYRQAGLALLYGGVGTVLVALGLVDLAIVFLFLLGPMLLVGLWSAQVHRAARPTGQRTPQTAQEWAADLARCTDRVRAHAAELDTVDRRVHRVDALLADLHDRFRRDDAISSARQVASVRRRLAGVQKDTRMLTDLLTDGSRSGHEFAAQWHHDPAAACVDFGQLPYAIEPGRITELVRPLVLVSRLCADWAHDAVLGVSGVTAPTADEISAGLTEIARLVQDVDRGIRNDCRNMLRAADTLHSVVTAVTISELDIRRGATRVACAAVAASALTRSLPHRATIRTVFLRELSRPRARGGRGGAPIGRATLAAVSRGRWRSAPLDLVS